MWCANSADLSGPFLTHAGFAPTTGQGSSDIHVFRRAGAASVRRAAASLRSRSAARGQPGYEVVTALQPRDVFVSPRPLLMPKAQTVCLPAFTVTGSANPCAAPNAG